MTTASFDPRTLPDGLRDALARVDRRLRGVAAMRGLGVMTLTLAVGMMLGMLADAWLVLPTWSRWAIWGAWLASGIGAGAVLVARPTLRRIAPLDLAATAERADPSGLGERLTAAVALVERGDRAHGSPTLIAALVKQANAQSDQINPALAVPLRTAARRLGIGLGGLALVLLPAMAGVGAPGDLARRFLLPWADIERVGRHVVTVLDGDRVVALGDDVEIVAEVRSRFGGAVDPSVPATLAWSDEDGRGGEAPLVAAAVDGNSPESLTWRVTRPRIARSFRYRVAFGAARSPEHAIRVLEPPRVLATSVNVSPPAYLGRSISEVLEPSIVEAWEGSEVSVTLRSSVPLVSATLRWPRPDPEESMQRSKSQELKDRSRLASLTAHRSPGDRAVDEVAFEPVDAEGVTWAVRVPAWASGAYGVVLTDRHGLRDRPGPASRVVVVPDRPPTVALTTPDGVLVESRPDDRLPVGIEARDDVSVTSAEVHYAIVRLDAGSGGEAVETGHVVAGPPGLDTRVVRGDAVLDLAPFALRAGDVVGYRVRVIDNRPPPFGPNEAWTPERTLTIVEDAPPNLARRAAAERDALREELESIRRSAAETRQATERLRYAADAAARNNGTWDEPRRRDLADRAEDAREVVDRLQLLARELAKHPTFAPLEPPTREVAEGEADAGRSDLDAARRAAEDAPARLDALKSADANLGATVGRLDALKRQLDELARNAPPPSDSQPQLGDPAEDALADGSEPSPAGEPTEEPVTGDPTSQPAGTADAELADLEALVESQSGHAWGELPGHLRAELLRQSQTPYRPDYARIIRLYFREIAEAGSEPRP